MKEYQRHAHYYDVLLFLHSVFPPYLFFIFFCSHRVHERKEKRRRRENFLLYLLHSLMFIMWHFRPDTQAASDFACFVTEMTVGYRIRCKAIHEGKYTGVVKPSVFFAILEHSLSLKLGIISTTSSNDSRRRTTKPATATAAAYAERWNISFHTLL